MSRLFYLWIVFIFLYLFLSEYILSSALRGGVLSWAEKEKSLELSQLRDVLLWIPSQGTGQKGGSPSWGIP